MSVFASIGVYNRESDWMLALAGLLVVYLVIYPSYILYLRYRHMKRIKHQLVTSMYKLPIRLTPVELAYIFSAKIKKPQLYATLLDFANRSIAILHSRKGNVTVETGPKVDNKLHTFEKLLEEQYKSIPEPVKIEQVLEGTTNYELPDGSKVSGSRQYVFWWLLRETLRERNIIQRDLNKRYIVMLFSFGILGSLAVTVITVGTVRFLQMINYGEVDITRLMQSINASLSIWLIMIIPMTIISFGLLKYKGKMLGRDWIMTSTYKRYLGQMDAFREFVRLTHKGTLRFESKELYDESIAVTRPYAIACGYIKK